MTDAMKAKVEVLAGKEEFMEKLQKVDSVEATLDLFKENGLELTEADLEEVENLVAETESDELDADALDDVAGGWAVTVIKYGVPLAAKILKCNKHTNWGRNNKKCICGCHFFF